ncbi:MAG TPA: efflux RND transporter periplasmic adaptor subunit [Bryobacteraceae bacterium]|jgi:cobalt-zinc-cadmium efflux system membrane fusion protein|nr:efflux RND transporter periplasmic adaptor subunit [Bryobacteraceae bacterium]
MKRYPIILCVALALLQSACKPPASNPTAEAPPPLRVQAVEDRNLFEVDHPERFQLTTAVPHTAVSQLRVTGTVNPDVSRNVPVISLASGRVIEINARLGDTVTKGQLLLKVQSADISGAYNDYQQALADEDLARKQFERSKMLYEKGAIAGKDLEVAESAETKAKVTIKTTIEHLRVLGVDPDHPSPIVEITAPVSGVITDQQVTNAAGVQGLGSPSPFTISDLTHVWIVCDVYENDLVNVHLGETADIRLNAYPSRVLTGTISSIGPVLDPNIRTAKVRIEVQNPGMMRPAMFVTATFHGRQKETRAAVPATAILHLHDRDWVYVPAGGKQFRRVEVSGGDMLPGGMQELISGVAAGQQVIANALEFQNTVQR